jgi:hypothetical protein
LVIPIQAPRKRWRKKRRVAAVSDDIRLAIKTEGYYSRRLRDHILR